MHSRRRIRTSALALLGLLITIHLPVAARAEPSAEVRTYLTSINRLYESLEYERALEQLRTARRVARGVDDDVLLSLYEGIILSDLRRTQEASVAFRAALLLRPDVKLPLLVSPSVTRQFELLRKEVKKELATHGRKSEGRRQQARAAPSGSETPPAQDARAPAAVAAEPTPAPAGSGVSARGNLRSRALLPALAGGVLLAAGGVSYGLARAEQGRLREGAAGLDTLEAARRSADRGRTWQTLGFSLAGAGVVGLGVAAGMYALGAPAEKLSLGVGTDGTSAFVFGRWP